MTPPAGTGDDDGHRDDGHRDDGHTATTGMPPAGAPEDMPARVPG